MVDMAVTYNDTMDQIERNTALMNMLRAGDDLPMAFTALSYVSGNGSLSGSVSGGESLSLSSFSSRSYNANLNLSVNRGFSFTLNSLDNEQFMRGFLEEIPLEKLNYLVHGWFTSKPLLWTLLVNSVTFNRDSGSQDVIANEIDPKAWERFQGTVSRATSYGLMLERRPEQVPAGPRLSRDEAMYQLSTVISNWNPTSFTPPGAARPKIAVVNEAADPVKNHQIVMESEPLRFCFDPPDVSQWPYDAQQLCRKSGTQSRFLQWQVASKPSVAAQPLGLDSVNLRSAREVYQFVGKVVQMQLRQPGQSPYKVAYTEQPLMVVKCDESASGGVPLATVSYRGRSCHVPAQGSGHSAQVLQMLSLLATLSKVPGAIANSPAVLIK